MGEDIEPGRLKLLQAPCPFLPRTLSLHVCVLDAPSHFEARRPFAAILVPRGQELDWVFCEPNGLWDLLFSASVSRLVVLHRLTQQREGAEEEEEEEEEEEVHPHLQDKEQQEHLCVHPHFQATSRGNASTGTSQSYHVCVDDVDVATHNSNEEEKEEERQHQQAKDQQGDLCTCPHFQPTLRLTQRYATLNSNNIETEHTKEQHRHLCAYPRTTGVSGTSQSHPLHIDVDDDVSFKKSVTSLLHSLFPWSVCPHGPAPDPYVTYEDHVQTRLIVEKRHSESLGGGILVEDVELGCSFDDGTSNFGVESNKRRRIFRRRMRFQQMPNLIQTEVPIAIYKNGQLNSMQGLEDVKAMQEKLACNHSLEDGSVMESGKVGEVSLVELEIRLDHSKLVHKYLPPIVAGLVLASPCLEACIAANTRARFLAIGLGGGALPVFLHKQFGFSVLAVDTNEIVVDLARLHFGLVENEHLQVQVKDGMDMVFSIAHQACKNNFVSIEMSKDWQAARKDSAPELCQGKILSAFECADARMHVIVVDVNVADARSGVLSPPPCFLSKAFLLAVRMALHEGGMLVINVIPRTKHNFNLVVNSLRRVFSGIYQIQIEDNHVLFAFPSKIADINMSCDFALSVAHATGYDLFDKIEEIEESIDD